ncbi:MAG: hypothetical protein ACLSE9_08725 [Acutalibacteraceae bacterium]
MTYDEIGNPITFGSKTFEWCGRQLERITDGDRVSKTVNGIKTNISITEARAMEQILISAYTLDNLLNAGREIAVGNVAGFTGRIDNVISIFEGVAEDELLNLMGR